MRAKDSLPSSRSRPRPSLEARALRLLSMREHSRHELRTKLLRALERDAAKHNPSASSGEPLEQGADKQAALERIEQVLDALAAAGHLSESRFVESRVRTRAPRFGDRHIQAEIRRHGLDAETGAIEGLVGAEIARAQAIWQRKFGPQPTNDRLELARQMRFLTARGFSATTVRDVVRGRGPAQGNEA